MARKSGVGSEMFYFQAEAVEFDDGTLRITPQGIVSSDALAVAGAAGDERLFAGNGGAELCGGAGNDMLVGGAGADELRYGGCGNSTLVGGAGDDVLRISASAECAGSEVTAYGGAGSDRFELLADAGFDATVIVKDFRPGEDRLDLTSMLVMQNGSARAVVASDLDMNALSASLAEQGYTLIDLSRFVTQSGESLRGALRIELSAYGFPMLQERDFVLAPP